MRKPTLKELGLILFGIVLSLIILELILRILGFGLLVMQHFDNLQDDSDHYKILTLGESTTANLRNGQGSWPHELDLILNNKSKKFEIFNEAIPGTTTSIIVDRLDANLKKYNPDLVIVMMGVNDETSNVLERKSSFMENFKAYKLFSMIFGHISYKINEGDYYNNSQQDQEFQKKEIEMMSDTPNRLIGFYIDNKYYDAAENLARELAKKDENPQSLSNLAEVLAERKKYSEAEKFYIESIKLNPDYFPFYIRLAGMYLLDNKTQPALNIMNDAHTIKLRNEFFSTHYNEYMIIQFAKINLGLNLTNNAYEALFFLLSVNQKYAEEVHMIGGIYEQLGKEDEIIELFRNIVEKNPENYNAYAELAWDALKHGNEDEADSYFLKIENLSRSALADVYKDMARRYEEAGNKKKSAQMMAKSDSLKKEFYSITRKNYLVLYDLVDKRGAKLAVMQYPLRNVDNFKEMFTDNEDIVFISNKENFEDAVALAPYAEYFIDTFGKDFGHVTKKGNILIAENVADYVLKISEDKK